ncbi:hypothetical protein ISN45_At05g062690 [Arabidopsis thaliana x Arabidopsis arenosa]|uniref:Uncharacterized protein n=2 Tax=Arabidopsis TaxID=3701 RepID=A0A8T2DS31_ARASU|nr:hypothetical protein ISN45_At05g062690 [Arabidopsis thaliana x Arabidopsis arenosa]KAG7614407.1 hypothetical protein ISN44_As05g061960 [Arabidopsis suecica]
MVSGPNMELPTSHRGGQSVVFAFTPKYKFIILDFVK